MSRASDFGTLTQEIAGAHETRVKVLGELAIDTKKMLEGFREDNKERADEVSKLLKEFDKAHAEMSAQLKADLAKVRPELGRDEAARIEQTRAEIKQRVDEVSKFLNDFDKAHAEMSAQLKADLAKVRPELARDEAARIEQTRAEIKQRVDEVAKFLNDFGRTHAEMSAQLKADLATGEAQRVEQTQAEIKQRVAEMSKLLKDFDRAHAEMSAQLKADLAKVTPELARDEAERVKQAQIEIKERVGAVTELLDDFRKEKEEAATTWQSLVSTIGGIRVGKKAPAAVVEEVIKKPEAKAGVVEEAPPVEEVTEEEAVARAEAAEVTPQVAEFQRRVFEYLADHPDGTRMVELEREFGMARIQMARILKNLISDSKVEKRDLLYFAI